MGQEKKSVNWRGWGVGVLVALILVVAIQNSQQISVKVLTASFDAPLIVVILISALIGAVIGYAAPVLLRHRRGERQGSGD